MIFDEFSAHEVLDTALVAWSREDIEGVLSCFVDDLTYWCNTGAPHGSPLTISGKQAFGTFLQSMQVAERVAVSEYFRLVDGVGRASIEYFVKHKRTGHALNGSYRQLISFRDGKIARLEEYHDAARMAAFWRLIAGEAALEHAFP
jgi:ketosteroid isomerase-like protein